MLAVVDEDRDVLNLNSSPMHQEASATLKHSSNECHCGDRPQSGQDDVCVVHCPHQQQQQQQHYQYAGHYRPGFHGHATASSSSHPASPAFKTPGKYQYQTPGKSHQTSSPAPSHRPGGGGGGLSTPQSQCSRNGPGYNPFEHDVVKQLHGPMFSPNVFTCNGTSTPRKNENSFVWSIDEQAILFPAEIDNMPHHQEHLNSIRRDDHSEREAQAAIDEFFSSQHIVPSPWIESEQMARTSQSTNPTPSRSQGTSCPSRINRLKNAAKEVGCQTSLSIPMDFDLMSVLGALHDENHSECDGDVKVVLSTSGTLRRKLFEHPMTSPLRSTQDSGEVGMSPTSPHLSVPFSPLVTPASTQFSSSPIQSLSSGRMSSSPGYQTGYQSDNGRRHQISARLFPQRLSGDHLMIGSHSDGASSPLSSPDISPIKFSQKRATTVNAASNDVKFRDQRLNGDSSYDSSESQDGLQSADCTDMMETSQTDGHQTTGIGNWGLSTIRESIDNDDVIDCEVLGSDTGYQTGSIQDSHHHTNLTQQLSHLPLMDSAQHSFQESSPRNNSRNSGVSRKELTRELAKVARVPLGTIADNVQGYSY